MNFMAHCTTPFFGKTTVSPLIDHVSMCLCYCIQGYTSSPYNHSDSRIILLNRRAKYDTRNSEEIFFDVVLLELTRVVFHLPKLLF